MQLDADTSELRWCVAEPVDRAHRMPPLPPTEVVKAVALYQMFEEDEVKPLACKIGPQPFAEDAQLAAVRQAQLDAFVSGGGSLAEFGLVVVTLIGKHIPLRAVPGTTVEELKAMIQDQEGIPPDQQRLIYSGKQVEDNVTLLEVGAGGCRGRGAPARPLAWRHQLHRGPAASQRRW